MRYSIDKENFVTNSIIQNVKLITFLGKTVILRKKAISVKEHIDSQGLSSDEAPSVFYVALTSCDKYGRPELPVSFFDGATKRSLMKHNIQVITVHDLVLDFKQACPDWDGRSDLFKRSSETNLENNQRLTKVFEDCYKKLLEGTMDQNVFMDTMSENEINSDNAIQEILRRIQNPKLEMIHLDVYIMLFSFIKRHRNAHIFVDELSIHHSISSKLKYL